MENSGDKKLLANASYLKIESLDLEFKLFHLVLIEFFAKA